MPVELGRMGKARWSERDCFSVWQRHDGERSFVSVKRNERRERVGLFPPERVLDASDPVVATVEKGDESESGIRHGG